MKTIKLIDKYEDAYSDYLDKHPLNLLYYSLKYRDLIKTILDCEPLYLIAIEEEEIKGILPLMIKKGCYGKIINSLPFYGSHGGMLYSNDESKKCLEYGLYQILDQEDVSSITIIQNLFDKNHQFLDLKTSETDSRIGQVTDLSFEKNNIECLLSKVHSKTRNMIRKAIKSNIKVMIDNSKIDFLEKQHSLNMNDINGIPKGEMFFKLIKKFFIEGKDYNIYVAYFDGKLVASLLVFYFGKVVEYFTPVIVKEFRSYQPLSLIIAKAMIDASKKGYEKWNWGGTWLNQDGVYRFKSRWNTKDYHYNYKVTIFNEDLYNSKKELLLDKYRGFYTIPFNKLK